MNTTYKKWSNVRNDIDEIKERVGILSHEYVDLGLPSGTLWATCNVGAASPTEYGNYYMYGMGAKTYDSSDTPYQGTENPLPEEYDTAAQVWGEGWRMPTLTQFNELMDNTTYEWATINGVNCGKFRAQNGNYVYFPAAGGWSEGIPYGGDTGNYWSSTPDNSGDAYYLYFDNNEWIETSDYRKYGFSVRPVHEPFPVSPAKVKDSLGISSTGSATKYLNEQGSFTTIASDSSKQDKITASGLLKGNGSGTVSAAVAGTDYQAPLTFNTAPSSSNKVATMADMPSYESKTAASGGTDESLVTTGEKYTWNGKADKATTLNGYGITDAYTKTEVNGLVDSPHQNYVTVATYASLPASGSADTIYRVANYDGSLSQVDDTKYSEYAWDGTQYVFLCVKSQIGEVFDISVYNNNAKYADLTAALGTNGANVPADIRRGGMSVKYVSSSDNNYVQFRYMPDDATVVSTFTNVANWQGVDEEPDANSKNLITSGAVYDLQEQVEDNTEEIEKKANKDGYYETLGAGTASNLRGQNIIEQRISYRPSGGNLDVATGAAFIDSIKGKTVKWNQLITNGDFSDGITGWIVANQAVKRTDKRFFVYGTSGSNTVLEKNINVSVHHFPAPIVGNKYYICVKYAASCKHNIVFGFSANDVFSNGLLISQDSVAHQFTSISKIVEIPEGSNFRYFGWRGDRIWGKDGVSAYHALSDIQQINLTQVFGNGNEPSTEADFETWVEENFGDWDYFANNDGSLISLKQTALKTKGFNLYNSTSTVIHRIKNQQYQITGTYTDVWQHWLEEIPTFNPYTYGSVVDFFYCYLVNGKKYLALDNIIDYNNEYRYAVNAYVIYNSKIYKCTTDISTTEEWNADHWTLVPDFAAMVSEGIFQPMSITPDANGIFTPTERYIHVEGGNATDTCVHLVNSGARNGDYEPYKESTKPLPITTMQGRLNGTGELVTIFPDGLKSVGDVYDEIKVENGVTKAIKRIGSVDLGTLGWYLSNTTGYFYTGNMSSTGIKGLSPEILCAKYISKPPANNVISYADEDVIWFHNNNTWICVHDSSITATTQAEVATAMNGVMLYYELETPLEYVVEGFEMPAQYLVDDWGTEMTIPQNDGEAVTALATLGIRYGVNAVDQLRRIPQTTITSESMDNFLIALGAQMGGTWTKTWNSETNKYDFTFTATPEPEDEEEVEPENN